MPNVEYVCRADGETYLPGEPGEVHGETQAGKECGSPGDFAGVWYAPGETTYTEAELDEWQQVTQSI